MLGLGNAFFNERSKLMIDWCKSSQVSNRTAVEVFFFFFYKCREMCRVMWWQNNKRLFTCVSTTKQDRLSHSTHKIQNTNTSVCVAKPYQQTGCWGLHCCQVTHLLVKWHLNVWLLINKQCSEVILVQEAWPNGQSIKHPPELACVMPLLPFLTTSWIKKTTIL